MGSCGSKPTGEEEPVGRWTEPNAPKQTGEVEAVDHRWTEPNAPNREAFESGELLHEPPQFVHFDPVKNEARPLLIKEIKLPRATQTHEVCYEPSTRCVFVSQMSNSTLVRIPVDERGVLVDDQDAWRMGECDAATGAGISGLHNISPSKAHPGCLWMTLQYANELLLVDVRGEHPLRIRQVLKVPTLCTDPATGETQRVGGPHCMRECPISGELWDTPCRSRGRGGRSSCCDPDANETNMAELARRGHDTPLPDGWAVWRVAPSEYDPSAKGGQGKGGRLYPCLTSPPMLDFDSLGNVYVPQDGVDTVPFPASGATPRITGPAVARQWLYAFGGPPWCKTIRLIHLAFGSGGRGNFIYALASDLLEDEVWSAESWARCLGRRVIPLPTQDCSCHRIAVVDAGPNLGGDGRSIVITELASSKLLQARDIRTVELRHLVDFQPLDESVSTDADGFVVHSYTTGESEAGHNC
ncbi:hypothetical protein EMIHUDRAFT_458787 [Emiliania huxleyi CCMP1516]|uniref:Uncharacterized protein n=2 Tax=Emiliania huxleyi TaxID=2903 RepID=A0A0D3J6S3_EMIH1|nr:hypothetical protein EMIHUDRAFT_458787 [Emiliania huxleyi CCMP1516]EOD19208.1 hypothetical protein EMIHUDRAFT_458787 [Emiliania huxleyi CCMP1516]|eukprot:XP_005771637.1 hypothetical protein EMIHUDRAFT_458787 [Emiliania huxleyi CCMP1516]